MKVLVLGASGMIGSAMFRVLSAQADWAVWGLARSTDCSRFFAETLRPRLLVGVDVQKHGALEQVLAQVQPAVVVNCIGLTKHHREAEEPLCAWPLNAVLPHQLAALCALHGARLIHVSTDCVFSGSRGNYAEGDAPDASDVYGQSKHWGEVDYPHAVTLRTSTIGHELHSAYGLLEWFLAQQGQCQGFARAIFSGLPNTEFARVVRDVVIPHPELRGLYHVGAAAIDKYTLLQLLAETYGKQIAIERNDCFVMDRSLNSTRFTQATGYKAAPWPELIRAMHAGR